MPSETSVRMRINRDQCGDPTFTTFSAHFWKKIKDIGTD